MQNKYYMLSLDLTMNSNAMVPMMACHPNSSSDEVVLVKIILFLNQRGEVSIILNLLVLELRQTA